MFLLKHPLSQKYNSSCIQNNFHEHLKGYITELPTDVIVQ